MIRTKAILRQSAKLPVHQPSGSESSKEGALPDENGIFDEKGVVGESLSFMKRTALNLRSPGSESSSRSITFDSPKRQKSETNSARKTTKRLNLTNEEARNEVERLVKERQVAKLSAHQHLAAGEREGGGVAHHTALAGE